MPGTTFCIKWIDGQHNSCWREPVGESKEQTWLLYKSRMNNNGETLTVPVTFMAGARGPGGQGVQGGGTGPNQPQTTQKKTQQGVVEESFVVVSQPLIELQEVVMEICCWCCRRHQEPQLGLSLVSPQGWQSCGNLWQQNHGKVVKSEVSGFGGKGREMVPSGMASPLSP